MLTLKSTGPGAPRSVEGASTARTRTPSLPPYFHCALTGGRHTTRVLACTLDSLVRVSRRVRDEDFGGCVVKRRVAACKSNRDRTRELPRMPIADPSHNPIHGSSHGGLPVRCRQACVGGTHTHRPYTPNVDTPAPLLPFWQFQVLVNSLFKVLFIFPSRYLFAIGLMRVFSFRWDLPPTWSCTRKQLDSERRRGGWRTAGV